MEIVYLIFSNSCFFMWCVFSFLRIIVVFGIYEEEYIYEIVIFVFFIDFIVYFGNFLFLYIVR